jgi:hypothetical protein
VLLDSDFVLLNIQTLGDLMPSSWRFRAPLIAIFGVIIAMMGFALPATGATSGRASNTSIQVAGVVASAGESPGSQLAFTGAAVAGIAALGALLLVGGGLMVFAGRRRKVKA